MAVISASFHPATVFHFAKHRALEAVDLLDDLEADIIDIETRLGRYIPTSRLLVFWKGVFHTLKALSAGYYQILLCIKNSEWTWWIGEDEDRKNHLRIQKESMIKHLAVYDWILSVLKIAVKDSFEETRPWFLKSWPTTQNSAKLHRRLSCPEIENPTTTEQAERMALDLGILRWTQYLDGELRSTMRELQHQYNKGKVFEHYVHHLQWTMDEEREAWAEDKEEHGEDGWQPWPYPDESLKAEALDVPEGQSQQRHYPVGGVPTWQEDEDLQAIFS